MTKASHLKAVPSNESVHSKHYFQILKDNIGVLTSSKTPPTIGFTSFQETSDTIWVTLNLAEQYVKERKRVLVVDASLSHLTLEKFHTIDNYNGLSDIIHHYFHEKLPSSEDEDFDFWDVLYMAFLRGNTATIEFSHDDGTLSLIDVLNGLPVRIRTQNHSSFERRFIDNLTSLEKISKDTLLKHIKSLKKTGKDDFEIIYQSEIVTKQQFVLLYKKSLKDQLLQLSQEPLLGFQFHDFSGKKLSFYDKVLHRFEPLKNTLHEEHYFVRTIEDFVFESQHGFDIMSCGLREFPKQDSSQDFQKILNLFLSKYDLVLVNSLALANGKLSQGYLPHTEGNVLLVPFSSTRPKDLKRAMYELEKNKIKVLGTIVTRSNETLYNDFYRTN